MWLPRTTHRFYGIPWPIRINYVLLCSLCCLMDSTQWCLTDSLHRVREVSSSGIHTLPQAMSCQEMQNGSWNWKNRRLGVHSRVLGPVTRFQIPAWSLYYAGSGKIMNLSATQFPRLYNEDAGGTCFLVWVRIRTEELCVHWAHSRPCIENE